MKITKEFIKKLIKEEIQKISEAEGKETQNVDLSAQGVQVTLNTTDGIIPSHITFSKEGEATQSTIAIPEEEIGYFKKFLGGGLQEAEKKSSDEEAREELEKLETQLKKAKEERDAIPEPTDSYRRDYGPRRTLLSKIQGLQTQILDLKRKLKIVK